MYGWSPGIGDPTIYGWVTVAAYGLGAYLCWRASHGGPARERRFWLVLAAVMAFLCVNKQLDLQTLLLDFARVQAKRHGWYGDRRPYQLVFIFALGAATALLTVWLFVRMRRAGAAVWCGIVGLALLLFFVFVRASSIDKMDRIIGQRLGSVPVNNALELGGIAIVTLSAWAASRRRR